MAILGRAYSLVRKYIRLGVEDSAFVMFQEEMQDIRNTTKARSIERLRREREAYQRLKDKSLIKADFRNKKATQRMRTWLQRKEDVSLQDWINEVENVSNFRAINDFLADLPSQMINDIYYNWGKGLSSKEIRRRVQKAYERAKADPSVRTVDKVYQMIREAVMYDID